MDLSLISRTGGPVLLWRGPDHERLDLTGPVVANWVNKSVGLFDDYGLRDSAEDFTLFVPSPEGLHWRELVAILAVLLGGGRVEMRTGEAGSKAPENEFYALVPFGHEEGETWAGAEEIFVFNPPALALSTPVSEDFIDLNSAVRAYPDIASRRLTGTGDLIVDGVEVDWLSEHTQTEGGGILVSNSTPRPQEWPWFLQHLLGGGETLLVSGMEESRITDMAASLGEVRGRLGSWTK